MWQKPDYDILEISCEIAAYTYTEEIKNNFPSWKEESNEGSNASVVGEK